jgi:lipopolysaccharide transport system ATP-binding protein
MRGRVGALIALGAGFNPILSGRENIYVNGSILGLTKVEIDAKIDDIIDFAEISEFIDAPVQTYSSGMQVRLGFAVATAMEPDVLILDEVLAVGDVRFRMKCFSRILAMIQNGTSILFVSHNEVDIHRICSRVIVLFSGEVSFDGSAIKAIDYYNSLRLLNCTDSKNENKGYEIRIDFPFGSNSMEVLPHETISLPIEITLPHEIRGARIVLQIQTTDQLPLGTISSYSKLPDLVLSSGKSIVECNIGEIPLLSGEYLIYIALYGPRKEDFFSHSVGKYCINISSAVDYFGYGPSHIIAFNHHWKILK